MHRTNAIQINTDVYGITGTGGRWQVAGNTTLPLLHIRYLEIKDQRSMSYEYRKWNRYSHS